jgi:ribosomal 50S subunit-recycling heat shock protein
MRLDKYLKVSRLIKRRTVACEAFGGGRVSVNGKTAKPSHELKENDIIEISFGEKRLKVKVTEIKEHVQKAGASDMYEIIEHQL